MRLMVFSLFDRKARSFGPPLVAANAPTIARELRRSVSSESMLGKYPEDFDLVHLAYMDDETGGVTPAEQLELVENLRDILGPESENGAGS